MSISSLVKRRTVCVVDIDSTLANNEHRAVHLTFDEHGKIPQESWDLFLRTDLMVLDEPQAHAREVLDYMRGHGYEVIFLTGRNAKLREVTEYWLTQHMGWDSEHEPLLMRGLDKVDVPASKLKEHIFLEYVNTHSLSDACFMFFEDDKHVLSVWRKYGLVFQCPEVWRYMNPASPEVEDEPAWTR